MEYLANVIPCSLRVLEGVEMLVKSFVYFLDDVPIRLSSSGPTETLKKR